MYFVYFLQSKLNRKVYVGLTGLLPQTRLEQHNLGSNQWTRSNGPFELAYYETYSCIDDARQREAFYKSGFGRQIRDAILSVVAQFPPKADKV